MLAEENRGVVVLLSGPPASGKSTLSRALLEGSNDWRRFAVREFFTSQTQAGTPIGRVAAEIAAKQPFLPDEFVASALGSWLDQRSGSENHLLEGFPRNLAQARLLDELLRDRNMAVDLFLYLDVPDEVAASRSQNREVCVSCHGPVNEGLRLEGSRCGICGGALVRRPDDLPNAFALRLRSHRAAVDPLLTEFSGRGLLRRLDGRLVPTDIVGRAERALAERDLSRHASRS